MQTRNGDLHLVYTWKRARIRHIVFNLARLETWLEERQSASSR
jgi:predicted neuraminidase